MRTRFWCIALAGCLGCKGPDLIPVHSPGQPENPTGFCTQSGQSQTVSFSVKNQGSDSAGPSMAKVDFGPQFGAVPVPTPHLVAGQVANLGPVAIPVGCFNPDCSFRIVVDTANTVPETNENNNTATGGCIG